MLKVNGLSVEEVARATSSTAGAVKQKAHRAYQRLRIYWSGAPMAQRWATESLGDLSRYRWLNQLAFWRLGAAAGSR